MSWNWRIPAEKLLDADEQKRVQRVIAMLGVTAGTVIDSYELGTDGPRLSSVFLVSAPYLIEVRLDSQAFAFDVVSLTNVLTYLVRISTIFVPGAQPPQASEGQPAPPAAEPKKLDFAEIRLSHAEQNRTTMGFFGEDIDAWISWVMRGYSPSHLGAKG
jgi:hypothetical protein